MTRAPSRAGLSQAPEECRRYTLLVLGVLLDTPLAHGQAPGLVNGPAERRFKCEGLRERACWCAQGAGVGTREVATVTMMGTAGSVAAGGGRKRWGKRASVSLS